MKNKNLDLTNLNRPAFTIVELIIAISILAIITAITVVAYGGVQSNARDTNVKTEANSASKLLTDARTRDRSYPLTFSGLPGSKDTTFNYASSGDAYSLTVTSSKDSRISYCVTSVNPRPVKGACDSAVAVTPPTTPPEEGEPVTPPVTPPEEPPVTPPTGEITNGSTFQNATNSNCPTSRTWVTDKRDGRTYWIKKMPDGKCWMLTNLAYAGGGDNTHGDTKGITQSSSSYSYTAAHYYKHGSSSETSFPTAPSTSTSGSGQYGYLYNWCAAMGAQPSACVNGTSKPTTSANISICPAGWRLPTGDYGGEYVGLTSSMGMTNNSAGVTKFKQDWLAQFGGEWSGSSFSGQGTTGHYWTSGEYNSGGAFELYLTNSLFYPSSSLTKYKGASVRCVAN